MQASRPTRYGARRVPLILLVDDNPDNREVYEQYLTYAGYAVEVASEGDEGLLKAAALQPDLIVMDIAMPHLDGWEATRRLKSAPATSHIPIVALSGFTVPDAETKALEAGCAQFFRKPMLPHELLAELKIFLVPAGDTVH
jgi:two-component system cell cycle response regulator DivK